MPPPVSCRCDRRVRAPSRLRDAERTRAELLEVATAVFAEQGYSGARVDEIAERTRTTKRMIYYYFGGKEQLYLAVLENAYRGIREAEQSLQVDHVDPVDAIRAAGRADLRPPHRPPGLHSAGSHREHPPRRVHRQARHAARPRAAGHLPARTRSWRAAVSRAFSATDVDALDVHILISAIACSRWRTATPSATCSTSTSPNPTPMRICGG